MLRCNWLSFNFKSTWEENAWINEPLTHFCIKDPLGNLRALDPSPRECRHMHHLAHNLWELREPLKSPSTAKSLTPEVILASLLLLSQELWNRPEAECRRSGRGPAPVAVAERVIFGFLEEASPRAARVNGGSAAALSSRPSLQPGAACPGPHFWARACPLPSALAGPLLCLAAFVCPPSSVQMTVPLGST